MGGRGDDDSEVGGGSVKVLCGGTHGVAGLEGEGLI